MQNHHQQYFPSLYNYFSLPPSFLTSEAMKREIIHLNEVQITLFYYWLVEA
jgi:hypothetical protein